MKRTNLYWIILSVLISVILWIVINSEQNPYREETISGIKLELNNLSSNLAIDYTNLPSIEAKISTSMLGGQDNIIKNIRAYLDLSGITTGNHRLPVKMDSLDWKIKVIEFQPSFVSVNIEPIAKKEVKVVLDILGEPLFGFVSKPAVISPQTILVSGPESLVSKVSVASIEIKLTDVKNSISRRFVPKLLDDNGDNVRGVNLMPESVMVDIEIKQQLGYKTVPVIVNLSGNVDYGYRVSGIFIDPPAVTLVGDTDVLANLEYVNTTVININKATADITANPTLELPNLVSMARKQDFLVRILVESIEGTQTVVAAPILTNVASGLNADYSPKSLQIMISGPIPVMNTLRPQDIKVEISAKDLITGTYVVTPTITLPYPIKVISVLPEKFTLSLGK